MRIERCSHCPLDELDHLRANSRAGRLLDRVLELDFAMNNLAIPWSDVTVEEMRGVRVLREERDRYQRELQEEALREQRLRVFQSRRGH